jgi:hypothetical protein
MDIMSVGAADGSLATGGGGATGSGFGNGGCEDFGFAIAIIGLLRCFLGREGVCCRGGGVVEATGGTGTGARGAARCTVIGPLLLPPGIADTSRRCWKAVRSSKAWMSSDPPTAISVRRRACPRASAGPGSHIENMLRA